MISFYFTPSKSALDLMPKSETSYYKRIISFGVDIEIVSDDPDLIFFDDEVWCPVCRFVHILAWSVKGDIEFRCKECGHIWSKKVDDFNKHI